MTVMHQFAGLFVYTVYYRLHYIDNEIIKSSYVIAKALSITHHLNTPLILQNINHFHMYIEILIFT